MASLLPEQLKTLAGMRNWPEVRSCSSNGVLEAVCFTLSDSNENAMLSAAPSTIRPESAVGGGVSPLSGIARRRRNP